MEDLDRALQNVARETDNNRQIVNRAKELHKLQARLPGDLEELRRARLSANA